MRNLTFEQQLASSLIRMNSSCMQEVMDDHAYASGNSIVCLYHVPFTNYSYTIYEKYIFFKKL